MAGRNIRPQELPRHFLRPHPAVVEERLALQHREIQALLLDNQRLAAIHVALKQELSLAQQELRHLSATFAAVKAESEAQVRDVLEKSLKIEAEARSIDGLNSELAHVRDDVKKLSDDRKEMVSKLEEVKDELVSARSELQEFPGLMDEIEAMEREIQRGRVAVEYEKNMHANNLQIEQILEENIVSMAREIEKLQAELADAEKKAKAAAAAAAAAANTGPGYSAGYGNSDMGNSANSNVGPYAAHQVQGNVDTGAQYVSGAASHSPYGIQQNHVHS